MGKNAENSCRHSEEKTNMLDSASVECCAGGTPAQFHGCRGGDAWPPGNVARFPIRKPELFSPEINRQVLASGELHRLLYATIRALPYVQDFECREELKRALCELLLSDAAA